MKKKKKYRKCPYEKTWRALREANRTPAATVSKFVSMATKKKNIKKCAPLCKQSARGSELNILHQRQRKETFYWICCFSLKKRITGLEWDNILHMVLFVWSLSVSQHGVWQYNAVLLHNMHNSSRCSKRALCTPVIWGLYCCKAMLIIMGCLVQAIREALATEVSVEIWKPISLLSNQALGPVLHSLIQMREHGVGLAKPRRHPPSLPIPNFSDTHKCTQSPSHPPFVVSLLCILFCSATVFVCPPCSPAHLRNHDSAEKNLNMSDKVPEFGEMSMCHNKTVTARPPRLTKVWWKTFFIELCVVFFRILGQLLIP